jgi:membrane associated rhomboid family serine protease
MKNYSLCSGMMAVAAISCIDTSATARQQSMTMMMSQRAAFINKQSTQQQQQQSNIDNVLFNVRGGASKKKRGGSRTASLYSTSNTSKKSSQKTATGKKKVQSAAKEAEKKSAVSDTLTKYRAILPLTRIYITMVGVVTLLGLLLGDELSQGLLALDPIRTMYGLELWRPFTAACFLGPPSIGWLMSAYYLFEYGSSLERAFGTAQHLLFLLLQIGFLTVCSAFFGQPFFAQSVITSMLHVLSRSMPNQKVKWLIFTVPYWTLPYGLMASDVLQAGNAGAALPHVLGILSGHVYYFHKNVWPKLGGEDWLIPPQFLVNKLEGRSKATDSISNALKSRKKGSGRKLGSK